MQLGPIVVRGAIQVQPVAIRNFSNGQFLSLHRNRFRFGEISYAPFIDQRSGKPATGTMGVLVVTKLAVDAQAIGSALVTLGNREGQLRLGGVVPSPSVLWLLGDGDGAPLLATYRWSGLSRQ